MTNNSSTEIMVTEIGLRSDHFELLPAEGKSSRIKSDATVAVKTDFGQLTGCGAGGEAAVAMNLMINGDTQSHVVQVDAEPLDRIRDVECSERTVRDAVEVSFADNWVVDGTTLSTELVVDPRREIPVTLESVGGMILFAMQASGSSEAPLVDLEAGSPAASIPVEVMLIRCDVHAVSQAPDGYAFRAWIGVDNSEPVAITVLAGESLQAQLELIVKDCLGL